MNETKLIKAFQAYAKNTAFFGETIPETAMLQLIAAIGFIDGAELSANIGLMRRLAKALGVTDKQTVKDLLQGCVY